MSRGLFAGSTDYSEQPLREMVYDLVNWKNNINSTIDILAKGFEKLQSSEYWGHIDQNFVLIIVKSKEFYEMSVNEIKDILQEIYIEITDQHIQKLANLGEIALETDRNYGEKWVEYRKKDYGNPDFGLVERLYSEGRDCAVDMVDLSNLAFGLNKFVGSRDSTRDELYPVKRYKKIVNTFIEYKRSIRTYENSLSQGIEKLNSKNYWDKVDEGFRAILLSSREFYKLSATHLASIVDDMLSSNIGKGHVERIKYIGETAQDIDRSYGFFWHTNYEKNKDYNDDEFLVVDSLYRNGRQCAINIRDLLIEVEELEDLIDWNSRHWKNVKEIKNIFLSYSRIDSAIMKIIYSKLQEFELAIWVDETELEPGTPAWESAVGNAIRGAGCMVVLLSPDAEKSTWVGREIAMAETLGKRIFPLLVRGDEQTSIPFRLMSHQFIDARHDTAAALERLVASVRKHLGG